MRRRTGLDLVGEKERKGERWRERDRGVGLYRHSRAGAVEAASGF